MGTSQKLVITTSQCFRAISTCIVFCARY